MNVLIISARDKRKRYRFIADPIQNINKVNLSIFENNHSIIFYTFFSFYVALKNRKKSAVIVMGADYTGFLWILLGKFLLRSKTIMRIGGDPIIVRKNILHSSLIREDTIKWLKLYVNYIFTILALKMVDCIVAVNKHDCLTLKHYVKNDCLFDVIPQYVEIISHPTQRKDFETQDIVNILTITNFMYREKCDGAKLITQYLIAMRERNLLTHHVKFNILGDGMYLNELKDYVYRLNDQSDRLIINIQGFVEKTNKYYSSADIFLYCSTSDSLPNVLLEAQSFGLPLLINRFPPFLNFLQEDVNALFFNMDDFSCFSSKFLSLVENDNLKNAFSVNNREMIKKSYNKQTIANNWLSLFDRLIQTTN